MHFGVHFTIDGYNADSTALANTRNIHAFVTQLPKRLGMHTICDPVTVEVGPNNKKDPGGVSGFVMIAESHISIHTFPDKKFFSADVYTCQDELDTEAILSFITETFSVTDFETNLIQRGTRYGNL